jgi:hypothetical protein
MQWIADNLFVGNRLTAGQIHSSEGLRIDLRNIKSPIIVFCSWGDNITPPHQALDWILDLYEHEREIVESGQTIVYTMHQTVGHLGIFVSGKVATKEHGEFVSAMELIDVMPPGLYEAVITDVDNSTAHPELIHGRYLFRLEARTLDHIRALGGNDAADDQRFATVARVSEINLDLYRRLAAPAVRATVNERLAEVMRAEHPNRLRFAMFSDRNPFMQPVKALADTVRANRKPVDPDNPLLEMQATASSWITSSLQMLNDARDTMTEAVFLNTYGSPALQAAVGLKAESTERPGDNLLRETNTTRIRAELEHRFEAGHIEEALARALIYIRLPEGSVDERGFAAIRLMRASRPGAMRLAQFKELIKEQYLLVCMDEERAISAIPKLLGPDRDERKKALDVLQKVLGARGELQGGSRERLDRIESLFDVKQPKAAKAEQAPRASR